MNVRPSRVSSVSGVCTLSSTLTGEDENSISERSSRGRFEGIHQARASSARANSVSSSEMANSPSPGCSGSSYRKPTPSLKTRNTTTKRLPGEAASATDTRSSLW